jgi:hypothetical protein
MGKFWQMLTSTVMGVGMLVATGCSGAQIPLQPAAGLTQNYPSRSPVVNSISLRTQAGTRTADKKVNVYADGMVALSNVPWFQQGNDRTCAQAAISAVMNYWGTPVSYPQVVKEMNPGNLPTDAVNISNYLRNKGFMAQDYRKATINFLKKQINDGKPTIVLIDFGDLASEHYVVVKGYNDKTGDILYSDSVTGPNMLLDYASFQESWKNKPLAAIPLFGDKYAGIAFDVAVK